MRQKFRNQEPALSSWGCRRFRCNPDIDSTSIIIHSVLYEMSLNQKICHSAVFTFADGKLSCLAFLASNELGFDPAIAVVLSALAGPAVRALDKSDILGNNDK